MTRKSASLAAAVAFLATVALLNPVTAAEQEKPVATVNNVAIPQVRFDVSLKAAMQQGQPDSPELRAMIKEELIDLELIAQEVHKKGLDKQPEVAQIVELTSQNILRNAYAKDYITSHPIGEEKLKQDYESQKKTLVGKKEYKVAHILVDSEKEAQAIAASLKNKGDFAKIAKEKSKDPGSKEHGGDLGWTNPGAFMPSFAEALVKLNKGQTSGPVQTKFGWHILKLQDVRDMEIPAYDKVKPSLEKRMQQLALQETVKSLRAKAKIS